MGERRDDDQASQQAEPDRIPKKRRRKVTRRVLLPTMVLIIIMITFLVLANKKVKNVNVDISLQVSKVSFTVDKEMPSIWFSPIPANSITLQSFQELMLEGELEIATTINLDTKTPERWLKIKKNSVIEIFPRDDFRDNPAIVTLPDVTLHHLRIAPASTITISSTENDPKYLKLTVNKGSKITGEITPDKTTDKTIRCDYCSIKGLSPKYERNAQFLRFTGKRNYNAKFSGQNVMLENPTSEGSDKMKVIEREDIVLKENPDEYDLDFTQIENRKIVSTIIGEDGNIKIKDTNKDINVKSTDIVILDRVKKDFKIKNLEFDNGIHINLSGHVGRLLKGNDAESLEDLRPSILEWLRYRPLIQMLGIFLGGILAIILIMHEILTIVEGVPKVLQWISHRISHKNKERDENHEEN